jgi:hypothetical protein
MSLTSLVLQMNVGKMQTSNAYGICLVEGHLTDMYVTLQEKSIKQVNETSGFTRQL